MHQRPPLLHFRSVFISDIHLGYHGCRAELLLDFLRHTRTEHLYLVGDIIDLESLKQSFYWPESHSDVIRALLGKARHGTRVVYIPGNHDHQFRDYCGLSFGKLEVRRSCLHTTAEGSRFLVTHGDQYDCRVACHPLVAGAGNFLYRRMMGMHSRVARLRSRLGMDYWSLASFIKSRSASAQRYIDRYKQAVTNAAMKRQLDGVICGHIHRPERDYRKGVIYINDGDWVENCTALVEHQDGRLELLDWPRLQGNRENLHSRQIARAA